MRIDKNTLISSYAQSMGLEAAKALIIEKIKSVGLKEKEFYTPEEITKICNALIKEGGLVSIVAQKFMIQLERKRAEEQALLLDNIETQIWYLTDSETYGLVNKAHADFLGWKKEQLEGKKLYEVMEAEGARLCIAHNRAVFEDKKQTRTEEWIKNHRGELRLLSIIRTPKLNRKGEVEYVICAAEDVTAWRQAQDALKQSQRILSIQNKIANIFLTVADQRMYAEVLQVVLEVTRSPHGIFGYIDEKGAWVCPSITEGIWKECRMVDKDIVFPPERWGGLWGKAMLEKRLLCSNKPFCVPEGHIPIFRALDVPIVYQGKLIGNLLVANKETDYDEKDKELLQVIAEYIGPVMNARLQRDVQEQEKKKLQLQLYQAQKMEAIGMLAGGVAHDFNNMLSVILGRAELALYKLDPSSSVYKDIQEIIEAAKRSSEITRQLLTFARRQAITPQVLNLNRTVEGMLKMLRRLIGEDIDLVWLPQANLWPVKMDPVQVDQILVNLCLNARDAIGDGGKITIETGNVVLDEAYCAKKLEFIPGEYVMLAVSDNGCGMDKKTLERIFDPFFTTKEIGKGSGLGLSTVYGIVKQNSGFINVYSELNKGTTFKIYLPRDKSDVVKEPEGGITPISKGCGETVLVVEDELSILNLTERILTTLGYKVLVAKSPKEALELAKKYSGEISLLITDVVMPEMNGWELSKQLLSIYPNLKCLYMSGYTANATIHHHILSDNHHFIQKPFSVKDLAAKLRELLDNK